MVTMRIILAALFLTLSACVGVPLKTSVTPSANGMDNEQLHTALDQQHLFVGFPRQAAIIMLGEPTRTLKVDKTTSAIEYDTSVEGQLFTGEPATKYCVIRLSYPIAEKNPRITKTDYIGYAEACREMIQHKNEELKITHPDNSASGPAPADRESPQSSPGY